MDKRSLCAKVLIGFFLLASSLGGEERRSSPVRVGDVALFRKSADAAADAMEHYGEYENRRELLRVAGIGYQLVRQSSERAVPFSFYLINLRIPNAFALPGGQIFITRGMLDLGLDDAQLAALLGHEIAHVTGNHGVRMQRRATLLNALSTLALAGAIVSSDSGRVNPDIPPDRYGNRTREGSGDTVMGTAVAGVYLTELLMRSYSRSFEDEADEEGQRLAAAAGFDPRGAESLMTLLETRLPQTKQGGYWNTHPFFTERLQASSARATFLKTLEGGDASTLRASTQVALLLEAERPKAGAREAVLKLAALTAWPQGAAAEGLRREVLQAQKKEELAKVALSRNYGELIQSYEMQRREVHSLTPESNFVNELASEIKQLRAEVASLEPKARKVFLEGFYETAFLESFLLNYPDHPLYGQVSLRLGESYTRLGRKSDAVKRFLATIERDPGGEWGQVALRGLKVLASGLKNLTALQELTETGDRELRTQAESRLALQVEGYETLENGAEYLENYPNGAHSEKVLVRQEKIAEKLYGEIQLYQAVDRTLEAAERIQQILTHAPQSKAAKRLSEQWEQDLEK